MTHDATTPAPDDLRTWRYFTASGTVATVTASKIYFEHDHVVFRDVHNAVVLAEDNANVRCLAEDNVRGSSARRPPADQQ